MKVLLVPLFLVGTATGQNKGISTCPCIADGSGPLRGSSYVGTIGSVDGDCVIRTGRDGTKHCYPVNYGEGECKTWDETLPPMCVGYPKGQAPPEWCTDAWCWVDKKKCLGVDDDDIVPSVWFTEGVEPTYSYGTCGVESLFAKFQASLNMKASELISVVEKYSGTIRAEVEDSYTLTGADENQRACSVTMACGCSTCKDVEWKAVDGQQIKLDYRKSSVVVKRANANRKDADMERLKCMAGLIAAKFKSIVRKEYNDKNRIAYMYFGDQKTGALVTWPAQEWCSDTYDARFRPWYAGAASGPKDLIIVLDTSGSMGTLGLMEPAIEASKKVLQTLTPNDYATVVTYNSRARVYDEDDILHSMTPKQLKKMEEWLAAQPAVGGTNFLVGFTKAAEIFEASAETSKTSGCSKLLLFLTDGQDTQGFKPSDLKPLNGLKGVSILTYSFGPEADIALPKQIACQNKGIWYHVMDKNDIADTMAQYYGLLAAGIDSDTVRWSQYLDAVTGTQLITGCLTSYERTAATSERDITAELVGVSCMDINVMISIPELMEKPTYDDMMSNMEKITKTCPLIKYGTATLQQLRKLVSPESVCQACDNSDEGCGSQPAPSPPGSPSPSPSPGGGSSDTGGGTTASDADLCQGLQVSGLLATLLLFGSFWQL